MIKISEKNQKKLKALPIKTGVYIMRAADNHVLYVGKARNLSQRVGWYFQNSSILEAKTSMMVGQIADIDHIETVSELDALLLEASLIKKYRPKYNVIWRDDKHPLYIKITSQDQYPRVMTTRREEEKNATYFGPFPSSRIARQVLRFLRKVFPYCTQRTLGKACFYTHLGLCNPCPSWIAILPPGKVAIEKRKYRRSIRLLTRALSGESESIMNELKKDMKMYAKRMEYEKAQQVKKNIEMLTYVTQLHFESTQYLTNPNLASDIRKKQVEELRMWLLELAKKEPRLFPVPHMLARIECFDISNLAGKLAVGSMVVFIDGESQTSLYRRFKIRLPPVSNDPAMIGEILKRRLNHPEWAFPQLLIVDGGRTQVAAAQKVLGETHGDIFIAGLAKKREELILPLSDGTFLLSELPKRSGGRFLLQQVRDEAHRFAITYHKLLRKKNLV